MTQLADAMSATLRQGLNVVKVFVAIILPEVASILDHWMIKLVWNATRRAGTKAYCEKREHWGRAWQGIFRQTEAD